MHLAMFVMQLTGQNLFSCQAVCVLSLNMIYPTTNCFGLYDRVSHFMQVTKSPKPLMPNIDP